MITALEEARYTLTLHRDTVKELGDSLRIEELREACKGHVSLFSGVSGVVSVEEL